MSYLKIFRITAEKSQFIYKVWKKSHQNTFLQVQKRVGIL